MEEVKVIGRKEDEFVVTLSGELDFGKAEELYNAVMEGYAKTPANARFDCAGLEFIDSTTLGTFVKICKELQANGHSLTLGNLQPKIKKLFVICALDKIIVLE